MFTSMKFPKIKFSVIYNRMNQLNEEGKALIQIKAYQSRKSRYFSTGIYIAPKFWDARSRKIKHTYKFQFLLNKRILAQIEAMEAYEINMMAKQGGLSIDRLDEYDQSSTKIPTFTAFYQNEIKISTIQSGQQYSSF